MEPTDEQAVQKLCESWRILPHIATEVGPFETFSSAFEGPYDVVKLRFVAAHADPPGERGQR